MPDSGGRVIEGPVLDESDVRLLLALFVPVLRDLEVRGRIAPVEAADPPVRQLRYVESVANLRRAVGLLPPKPRRHRYPGRRPIEDRAAPAGVGSCSRRGSPGTSCHGAGWLLRGELPAAAGRDRGRRLAGPARPAAGPAARARELDLDRCAVGGSHVPSVQRGDQVGPSPVDRGRPGSKHHLMVDAGGIPLAVTLTGGHRNDITQLLPLVDAIAPIRGRRGRPLSGHAGVLLSAMVSIRRCGCRTPRGWRAPRPCGPRPTA